MNWWDVLGGAMVSWPPVAVALWLGRKKLDRQTRDIQDITDLQTETLKPHTRRP